MTENQLKLEARNKMYAAGSVWWFPPPRWLPSIKKWQREDIFGIFDLIEVDKTGKISFIQITTIQHISDRRKKILNYFNESERKIKNAYVWGYNPRKGVWKIEKIK